MTANGKRLHCYKVTKERGRHRCNLFNHVTMERLLLPLVSDDLQHLVSARCLLKGLAKFRPMQEFGDVGQRVKVLLKLALWHEEKNHQIDRLIIQ